MNWRQNPFEEFQHNALRALQVFVFALAIMILAMVM